MITGSCNVAADETQKSLWQKFISGKFTQQKPPESHGAWGQKNTKSLTDLNIKNRDLNELSRSRDGTITIRFGENGLNITKRF
jgi:hypothetical protein